MTHETPPQPEPPEHPRWHESGCETCAALDPLLVALNDIEHVDGAERDLIVRLAGGALDAARSDAPVIDKISVDAAWETGYWEGVRRAARLPVSGESEGLRDAAQAALDEWDAATRDWLEWFARGGKGFHQFPRAARNRLATALRSEGTDRLAPLVIESGWLARSPSEAGIDVDAAYDRRERTADALAVHVGSMRAHDIVDDIIDAYEGPEVRTEGLRTATAWLIERGQNRKQTPPIYWRSRGELPSDADEWTADPWQAARFSTRAAAEEAIHSLTVRLEAVGDPVEHGFLTHSSEARTEPEAEDGA